MSVVESTISTTRGSFLMGSLINKSVHITNYYHKNSGGISTSYDNLLEAAERHKRYVRLIVPGETEEVEDVNPYARIYYVPARRSPVFDKRYRVIMPWQYMLHDTLIRRILLAEQPDMIEVTDKYTLSLLGLMIRSGNFRKLGRPMLVHFSCERMDDNISSFLIGGPISRSIARFVMRNYNFPIFDFHIANSEYTADEFHTAVARPDGEPRTGWLLNKAWRLVKAPRVPHTERIFVCPRGVDIDQYDPSHRARDSRNAMLAGMNIPSTATVLLYAGRLSPEKNVGLLADLLKKLAADPERDYRLLVAGAGPKAQWLEEQGDRYAEGRIVMLGHLPKEKLAHLYANSDIFVHPNPREPFGIAPLEAMASGIPTIAPNAGGVLSYANSENAWLAEPDAGSFAAAVRDIVSDQAARDKKVRNALDTARHNTREMSTDRLMATYDKMYHEFLNHNDLYTDREAARGFNYAEVIKLASAATLSSLISP
ncbi:MAG: glycosyltransferase [Acidobacteriota bacterium]